MLPPKDAHYGDYKIVWLCEYKIFADWFMLQFQEVAFWVSKEAADLKNFWESGGKKAILMKKCTVPFKEFLWRHFIGIDWSKFVINQKRGNFKVTFFFSSLLCYNKIVFRTSLVVQWLRIHLPGQGTWVWSLVWEDSTWHRATMRLSHNYSSPCA